MNKKEIRQLGLGFLISAIILSGYALFSPDTSSTNAESSNEESSSTETSSEANSSVVVGVEENTSDESTTEEESSEANETESTTEEESTESSSEPTEVTVTVNNGDTPDVVINDLVEAGIIEDGQLFYDYLNANGYDVEIKPGDHQVNSEMGYYDLAQELMSN